MNSQEFVESIRANRAAEYLTDSPDLGPLFGKACWFEGAPNFPVHHNCMPAHRAKRLLKRRGSAISVA